MSQRILLTIICIGMMSVFAGCFLDPDAPPEAPPVVPEVYEDQTVRWHVLHNLELSYSERNEAAYAKLLDETTDVFQFFFTDGDINDPAEPTPVSWGFDDELRSARNMFDENYTGDNAITGIDLDLNFDKDNVQWVEVVDDAFPTETWYQTIVPYDYTINATPDWTWITFGNSRAEFTVRQDPVSGLWKLARWRDLGGQQ
jgi:hypothetical protein